MSGRYASYWNAFLCYTVFTMFVAVKTGCDTTIQEYQEVPPFNGQCGVWYDKLWQYARLCSVMESHSHIYLFITVKYSRTKKITEKVARRMKVSLVWLLVVVFCIASTAARPQRKARARRLLAEAAVPAINTKKGNTELERLGKLQFVSIDSSTVKKTLI